MSERKNGKRPPGEKPARKQRGEIARKKKLGRGEKRGVKVEKSERNWNRKNIGAAFFGGKEERVVKNGSGRRRDHAREEESRKVDQKKIQGGFTVRSKPCATNQLKGKRKGVEQVVVPTKGKEGGLSPKKDAGRQKKERVVCKGKKLLKRAGKTTEKGGPVFLQAKEERKPAKRELVNQKKRTSLRLGAPGEGTCRAGKKIRKWREMKKCWEGACLWKPRGLAKQKKSWGEGGGGRRGI